SVTVSIAALRMGTLRRMRAVSRDPMSTLLGSTWERLGTSSTSANVSASGSPAATCGAAPNRSLIDAPSGSLAFLGLFPATAPTGVIAPDLRLVAPHGLDLGVVATGARRYRRSAASGGGRDATRRR